MHPDRTYDATVGSNDGVGRLTGVTDAAGSEAWTYDAQGRVISDARTVAAGGDSALFTTAYAWDANRKLTSVTYPSGDLATYTRTTDGLVTAVSFTPKGGTAPTLASNVAFAPYGPQAGATLPGGLTLTRSYNQDYQQTGLETASGSALLNASFGWQADGRIASVTDNLVPAQGPTSRTAAYTYAATGRLASAAGAWGSQSWSFDGGGNLISSASSGSAPSAQTLAWTYDAAAMMATASAGTGAWAYQFDGLRAWRAPVGAGSQTSYVYDRAGQTLAEANAATGAASKEYIWLGDQLLGVAIPGGSLYAATTGQLDEPQALTGPTGTLAWSGYVQPLGTTTTFATPTISLDLGYPGQWSQPEAANLARNGVRDYDPSLGRYAEPDPLGIDPGPNPYNYVDGDPVNEIDPTGLASCVYSISGATLVCTPDSGGPSQSVGPDGVLSGDVRTPVCVNNPDCAGQNGYGPISPGTYQMNMDTRPGHEGRWRLESVPKIPAWMYLLGWARSGFELHIGHMSVGCINVDIHNNRAVQKYNQVNALLAKERSNNTLRVVP